MEHMKEDTCKSDDEHLTLKHLAFQEHMAEQTWLVLMVKRGSVEIILI